MQPFPTDYSSLSANALLKLCIQNYDLGANASITFLKRGFNDTYLVTHASGKSILRVYKHNWRSVSSIAAEIHLLKDLSENKIPVSVPIADKRQKFIQEINAPEGMRYAVLFSYAEGLAVKKLSAEQSYLLGAETGKMHALTANRTGHTAHNYEISTQFEITLTTLKPVLIHHVQEYCYLLALKEQFMAVLNAVDKQQLQTGICHGDLQAENFHITPENRFTFFDFDFFGTGYLVYDIGVFMWYDHKNKTPEIMDTFLKGYQTQRRLSAAEIKLIPWLSTLRALFQMTLFCKINNGKQLPLWPAQQAADFIHKVEKWVIAKT